MWGNTLAFLPGRLSRRLIGGGAPPEVPPTPPSGAVFATGVFATGVFSQSGTPAVGRPSPWPTRYTGDPYFRRRIDTMALASNSSALISAFWKYNSQVNIFSQDYTYPIWFVGDATDDYTVVASNGNMKGRPIRWSPSWNVRTPSDPAADNQFILLDATTGEEWNGWKVTVDHAAKQVKCARCNRVDTIGNDTTYGATPKSWLTGDGRFYPSRGPGLAYGLGLVTPEEVASGDIGHALSMPTHGIHSSLYTGAAIKTDGPTFGFADGIPEGTIIGLLRTDAEIEAGVATIPDDAPPGTKSLARTFAKGWRDYGACVSDNSGAAHIQFEADESAASKWTDLGIYPSKVASNGKQYPRDIADHFVTSATPSRLAVFA